MMEFHWLVYDSKPVHQYVVHYDENGLPLMPSTVSQELNAWIEKARENPNDDELCDRVLNDRTFRLIIPALKEVVREHLTEQIKQAMVEDGIPNDHPFFTNQIHLLFDRRACVFTNFFNPAEATIAQAAFDRVPRPKLYRALLG